MLLEHLQVILLDMGTTEGRTKGEKMVGGGVMMVGGNNTKDMVDNGPGI